MLGTGHPRHVAAGASGFEFRQESQKAPGLGGRWVKS